MTSKRKVEVFTAGCPLCDDAVKTVKEIACESCEVIVYDLREGCATMECREKAKQYGVVRVPTVVVDGKIAGCCQGNGVDANALRATGIGQSL